MTLQELIAAAEQVRGEIAEYPRPGVGALVSPELIIALARVAEAAEQWAAFDDAHPNAASATVDLLKRVAALDAALASAGNAAIRPQERAMSESKRVPRGPTPAMFIAGTYALRQSLADIDGGSFAHAVWYAMYDAAPAEPEPSSPPRQPIRRQRRSLRKDSDER
jgi:hypothetical protein